MLFFCLLAQTGSTALFFASQQGHHDISKLLFEFGASTEFQTKVRFRDPSVCVTGSVMDRAAECESECQDKEKNVA